MDYQAMYDYINTHPIDDTYSRIILFLLQDNHESIESITTMAENCYVSPATISRFIKKFTNVSFDEFKKEYNKHKDVSPSFMFRLTKEDTHNLVANSDKFFHDYGNRVIHSIQNTMDTLDLAEIDKFLQKIHDFPRVFLFGYNSTIDNLKYLQAGFKRANKFLYLAYSYELQEQLAENLQHDDLAIIVTSYGTFFNKLAHTADLIVDSQATTTLITQSTNSLYSVGIDKIISISTESDARAGSYNMNFFLDYLARRYFFLYGER